MSKKAKKGGQTMAQAKEESRKKEEIDLQKQQEQDPNVDPKDEDLKSEDTDQGNDDEDTSGDEEEKTSFIQKAKVMGLKILKILIKWVLKPLAIAIVVFASLISLIINLGPGSGQQDDGDNSDPEETDDDIPEEEFEDESDQDSGEDQAE